MLRSGQTAPLLLTEAHWFGLLVQQLHPCLNTVGSVALCSSRKHPDCRSHDPPPLPSFSRQGSWLGLQHNSHTPTWTLWTVTALSSSGAKLPEVVNKVWHPCEPPKVKSSIGWMGGSRSMSRTPEPCVFIASAEKCCPPQWRTHSLASLPLPEHFSCGPEPFWKPSPHWPGIFPLASGLELWKYLPHSNHFPWGLRLGWFN